MCKTLWLAANVTSFVHFVAVPDTELTVDCSEAEVTFVVPPNDDGFMFIEFFSLEAACTDSTPFEVRVACVCMCVRVCACISQCASSINSAS